MTDGLVAGIDLGTTNSLVGIVRNGEVCLFGDAQGNHLLPSVVGFEPGQGLSVGRAAKNRRLLDPSGTVASIKRKMGTTERVRIGDKDLTPSQVSSLIIGALLDRVEKATGERPKRAVITVPAYFDNLQREATRDAGEMAGVVVERLVNEPTAAAVNYQTGGEERVLVYDLGGGTFDVSVLERDKGFLEVRASRGDTHLGGDDIDQALVAWILGQLPSAARATIERDVRGMTRLVEASERAKIALSTRDEVKVTEPFLAGEGVDAVHIDLALRRSDLEALAGPFIVRTLACVDEALRDASLKAEELDRVLLVGGSSKMPFVARRLAEHLGRPVLLDEQADRAVALGASLLAGRLAGEAVNEVLVDITPHTLAVGAIDGYSDEMIAAPVITRDTVIPTEQVTTVYTHTDDQPAAELPIVQGEHHLVRDNTWLGELTIEDLPSSPAGSPVEVRFRLDLSGVLHVDAKHLPSGKSARTTISKSPTRLSMQARTAAGRDVEALRKVGETPSETSHVSPTDEKFAQAMIRRAERAIAVAGAAADAVSAAQLALVDVQDALARKDGVLHERLDALSDRLLDLVDSE